MIKGVLHAHGRIPSPAVRLPLLPAAEAAVHTAMRRLSTLRTL
ncbi:putative truncated dihydrodipicolinate synthase [Actinoplanes missouriensis 431]|uniref:Putative truncated dihydrodipicolinate synthase n=1 Tax=Actinoplanes missouriensis (strain ATCC 14538 / DSM 43046 / CBS 188.64 / JCM 3121 / NBRC 102363 / NCIMB 12654 / NRRL B-3342 / UNCC 431) TaxID=512565 RepID=I0H8J2_ACTM4|nr:putative truncated dihydrodipicolinate synthase [Actinoplanes missouriensis 431]